MAFVSPWDYSTADYQGKVLSVRITFVSGLGTILGITSHKDAGCQYANVYFGLGGDGSPDSAASQLAIADGDNVIGVALLNGFGFVTIQDALASQLTAGP